MLVHPECKRSELIIKSLKGFQLKPCKKSSKQQKWVGKLHPQDKIDRNFHGCHGSCWVCPERLDRQPVLEPACGKVQVGWSEHFGLDVHSDHIPRTDGYTDWQCYGRKVYALRSASCYFHRLFDCYIRRTPHASAHIQCIHGWYNARAIRDGCHGSGLVPSDRRVCTAWPTWSLSCSGLDHWAAIDAFWISECQLDARWYW